jgi:hypothetical protein
MQVFGTAASPVVTGIGVGTGASKYSDIVTQGVNTLANGSTASLDDKLNAYQTLNSLLFSCGDNAVPTHEISLTSLGLAIAAYSTTLTSKIYKRVAVG